jgi:hypothetical protein
MHDDAGQPNDYQNWMVPKAHPLCKKKMVRSSPAPSRLACKE